MELSNQNVDRLIGLFNEHFGPSTTAEMTDEKILWSDNGRVGVDGQMDSLDKVEFIMACEEEFDITIADHLAADIKNRRQLVTMLAILIDAKNPRGG